MVIGNPPYVVYTKKSKNTGKSVEDIYKLGNYESLPCNNLYAFVIERCLKIGKMRDNIGMIVPLTIASNKNMAIIRKMITSQGCVYFSHYEIRPAKLFDGVEQRLTIFLLRNGHDNGIFSTSMIRWHNEDREKLFRIIHYGESIVNEQIWRFSDAIELEIYKKFISHKNVGIYLSPNIQSEKCAIHYRTAGIRYWIIFLLHGFESDALSNKVNYFQAPEHAFFYCAAFNSNLFWWYYGANFDMFNLKDYMIFGFHLTFNPDAKLEALADAIEDDLYSHRQTLLTQSATRGTVSSFIYRKKESKSIMDKIDTVLAVHYGFSEKELDFINSNNIKFRMGDSDED